MIKIVTSLEERKWLKDLWIALLILFALWFFFGGDNLTKEEYRGGYGYNNNFTKIL